MADDTNARSTLPHGGHSHGTQQAGQQAADTAHRIAEATRDAGQQMGDQFKQAGDQMRQSAERLATTGSELGLRLLDQAEANTREAFAAMRAAAQAKDVSEVVRIQADYLREQTSRAMNQAREIGELITSYGRDAMNQVGNR